MTTEESPRCPVCRGVGVPKPTESHLLDYECARCGWFFTGSTAAELARRADDATEGRAVIDPSDLRPADLQRGFAAARRKP